MDSVAPVAPVAPVDSVAPVEPVALVEPVVALEPEPESALLSLSLSESLFGTAVDATFVASSLTPLSVASALEPIVPGSAPVSLLDSFVAGSADFFVSALVSLLDFFMGLAVGSVAPVAPFFRQPFPPRYRVQI